MKEFQKRIQDIINECWVAFIQQLSERTIRISKEASMQLEFSYLLKTNINKAIKNIDESIWVDLEKAVVINNRSREIDVVIEISKGKMTRFLPIEMKCYRTFATSGGRRAAHDIFKYKVYEDMELLESYSNLPNYINGIQLTVTDNVSMVFPKNKNAKSWTYDTSEGTRLRGGVNLNTPIGGHPVNLVLSKNYTFNWDNRNGFYFLMLRGS